MKLIYCEECKSLTSIPSRGQMSTCNCGDCCGKYLSDNITAVVNKDAIIVGLDSLSYRTALERYKIVKEQSNIRYDYYFTGWVPTVPGEIIIVDTVDDVEGYEFDGDYKHNETSTLPTKD